MLSHMNDGWKGTEGVRWRKWGEGSGVERRGMEGVGWSEWAEAGEMGGVGVGGREWGKGVGWKWDGDQVFVFGLAFSADASHASSV